MGNALSEVTLAKESLGRLYKYVPTRIMNTWNDIDMKEIGIINIVRETSSEVVNFAKYLVSHPNMSFNDILKLVPPDRRKLFRSAFSSHTFDPKLDKKNGILRFERDQSDFLPPVQLDSAQKYREAQQLLLADIIVNSVIFALNLVGYPVTLKNIKMTVLNVRKILQDEEILSFFSRLLRNGEPDRGTSTLRLVVDVLNRMYKQGHIQEIVRDLVDASHNGFDSIRAIARVTVLIATAVDYFVVNEYVKMFLKGSELLRKFSLLRELSTERKSNL